ncbi:hypothetical protein HZB69_04950 [Candidatus Amesbacteria bacterium]|nr:hypothetical protein [Candidatus Amesbacteria bacterium]
MLTDLLISKTRVKLLEIFLSDVTQMYHVRDLVRRAGEEINAVRRELAHLEKCGAVKKEPRGNRLYYWFRKDYPLYQDLLSITAKTTGLGSAILKNKSKLGHLNLVMFSGNFVRHQPRLKTDDVDVLVVGSVDLGELSNIIHAEEEIRSTPINYTPMTLDELKFRRTRRDPFLMSILIGSRVMIVGDEEDLVA